MNLSLPFQHSCCKHSVLFNNICIDCGAVVEKPYENRLNPDDDSITLSDEELKRRNLDLERQLIQEHKLVLVIDLDKTLIDTTTVFSYEEAQNLISTDPTASSEDFVVFDLDSTIFVVRFRPYVREFLQEISPYFHLQIYTGSQAEYAHRIIRELDPNGKYFADRIWSITKEEKLRFQQENIYEKSIKNLFPYSDKLVLVLDDSPSVWYSDEGGKIFKGLIQLKPFLYFIQPTPSTLAAVSSTGVVDDTLNNMKQLLLDIHASFYQDFDELESHVIIKLAEKKSGVFDRLHFLFVGCWEDGDQERKNQIILKAEEFGANVIDSFVPYLTHIIIGFKGPDDQCIRAMNYSGIYIVTADWFEQSHMSYQRLDEDAFQFPGFPSPTCGFFERDEPPNIINTDFDESEIDQLLEEDEEEGNSPVPRVITLEDFKKEPGILDRFLYFDSDEIGSDEQAIEQL